MAVTPGPLLSFWEETAGGRGGEQLRPPLFKSAEEIQIDEELNTEIKLTKRTPEEYVIIIYLISR